MADEVALAVELEKLRGEFKLAIGDVRHDVSTWGREITRRQDEANGKVADHDAAIAAILERHRMDDQRSRDARIRWEERTRLLRLGWKVWRLVNNQEFVLKAGLGLIIAVLLGKEWWPS